MLLMQAQHAPTVFRVSLSSSDECNSNHLKTVSLVSGTWPQYGVTALCKILDHRYDAQCTIYQSWERAQAVEDAMKAGIDRFGFAERENVERVKKDLRLDTALAKSILDEVARRAFQAFISRSRTKSNRLDAAKEIKGLVFFSNIVVAPLLEDVDVRLLLLSFASSHSCASTLSILTSAAEYGGPPDGVRTSPVPLRCCSSGLRHAAHTRLAAPSILPSAALR